MRLLPGTVSRSFAGVSSRIQLFPASFQACDPPREVRAAVKRQGSSSSSSGPSPPSEPTDARLPFVDAAKLPFVDVVAPVDGKPAKPAKPVTRSAFRRPKVTTDVRVEAKRKAATAGRAPSVTHTLPSAELNHRATPDAEPKAVVLLIDGYNVIHSDNQLWELMDRVSTEYARHELQKWVVAWAAFSDPAVRVIIVYDALGNLHRKRSWTHAEELPSGVEVVFPANTDADTYIIREARRLAQDEDYDVVVMSQDHEVQCGISSSAWQLDDCAASDAVLREMRDATHGVPPRLSVHRHLDHFPRPLMPPPAAAALLLRPPPVKLPPAPLNIDALAAHLRKMQAEMDRRAPQRGGGDADADGGAAAAPAAAATVPPRFNPLLLSKKGPSLDRFK